MNEIVATNIIHGNCVCKKDSTHRDWDSFYEETNSGRQVGLVYDYGLYCGSCGASIPEN